MKLGTRLLRDGVIGLSELEAGLRAQVLYGGRLGTNLVELGFIDVDVLGKYLAICLGAPEATSALFEAAAPELVEKFGKETAEQFTAFPLDVEDDGTYAIAVLDPLDTATLLELEKKIGEPVRPYTAAEMRIFFFLEKHYEIERNVRFVRTTSPPQAQGAIERRRVQGAPRQVRVEPRRSRKRAATPAEPLTSFAEATRAVESATDRASIGDAILRYGEGRFEVLVLMLLRDGKAMGWMFHSVHAEASVSEVDQLSIGLSELSVLSLAHGASEAYWGPPPTADAKIESEIWWATGSRQRPDRCLVVPVLVRDRVVQLIYAHSRGELPGESRRELSKLASHASAAYLRLIRDARKDRD